jgi:DNA-binding NarL/FixJ family response regulator
MEKRRLLLADDHTLMLEGLRKLLAQDFELVGTVTDGRAAVAAFDRLRPDLLLLDIGLPLLNGFETARQVKKMSPSARILFVTMQTDRDFVEEAFRSGASGYVLKQAPVHELMDSIRTVLEGHYYLSSLIAEKAGAIPFDPSTNPAYLFASSLSARQREVLQLVAEGKSMKGIADILGISVRTVEFHKNNILRQLDLHTTAELTRYALDHRIVST